MDVEKPAALSQGHGPVKVAGASGRVGVFDLGLRSAPPGGEAKMRPYGLEADDQRAIAAALAGKTNTVTSLAQIATEKHLDKLNQPTVIGGHLPDEVELYTLPDGHRFLVEDFTDLGSCRDHWVGIQRRTPLAPDNSPSRDKSTYWVGGSTWFYERALTAWIKGDVITTLRYLGPTLTWSPPMGGAVRNRLSQATYAQKDLKAKLAVLHVAKGQTVQLLDEPHSAGHPVATIVGGAGPTADGELRIVAKPQKEDGYRRFDAAGGWLLVAAPSTWQLGFVAKKSLGAR